MHLPAASLAVRVFRLILYWKRILISGSSTIGNGHSLQAHLVLDNSRESTSPNMAVHYSSRYNILYSLSIDLICILWRETDVAVLPGLLKVRAAGPAPLTRRG